MNLIINYDFFNAIKDVNEPLSPFKVMRNSKRFNTMVALPCFIIMNSFQYHGDLEKTFLTLPINFSVITLLETFHNMLLHKDEYKEIAMIRLKRLVQELNDLNIDTNYDLLLKSELYQKKYHLRLNDEKLTVILESKYILMPTYKFNGNINDTSVLQQHVVGSKTYVLSLGTYQKEQKLVYNNL